MRQAVGPESIVALALPRGADAVVAMLAATRTGAAYLPIDPGYPADRIAYMLADRHATTDELYCGGATFRLRAWSFTDTFPCLQALQPGCFAAAVHAEQPRT